LTNMVGLLHAIVHLVWMDFINLVVTD